MDSNLEEISNCGGVVIVHLIDFDQRAQPFLIAQFQNPLPIKKAFSNSFHHEKSVTIPILDYAHKIDYFNMHILHNKNGVEMVCLTTDATQIIFCDLKSGKVVHCVEFDVFSFSLILEERCSTERNYSGGGHSLFAILSSNEFVASFDLSRIVGNFNSNQVNNQSLKMEDCVWKTEMDGAFSLCLLESRHPMLEKLIGKQVKGHNLIVVGTENGFKLLDSFSGELIHKIEPTDSGIQSAYLVGVSNNPFHLTFVCTEIDIESNSIVYYLFDSRNNWKDPKSFKCGYQPLSMDFDSVSQYIYLCAEDAIHVFSSHGTELFEFPFEKAQSISIDNQFGLCYIATFDEEYLEIMIFS